MNFKPIVQKTYGKRGNSSYKRKRRTAFLSSRKHPTQPASVTKTTTNQIPTPSTTFNFKTTQSTNSFSTSSLSSSSKNHKKKPKLQQLFLDFGQKSFSSVKCTICNMMYAPGKEEDEISHRIFHRQSLQPILFRSRNTDVCCWNNGDGRDNRRILQFSMQQQEDRQRTLKIRQRMAQHLCDDFNLVDEEQNEEMEKDQVVDPNNQDKTSKSTSSFSSGGNKTLYIYLQGHKVIGGLLVQAIVPPSTTYRLEVLQIYVEKKYRLQNIATHLINVCRSNAIYGELLYMQQIKMDVTSKDGAKFWSKCMQTVSVKKDDTKDQIDTCTSISKKMNSQDR